jgi:paraquat-inducible protein B
MFGYNVMPTVSGGLGELQDKATAVLDKLAALPLDETLKSASEALAAVKTTVAGLNTTVSGFNRGLAALRAAGSDVALGADARRYARAEAELAHFRQGQERTDSDANAGATRALTPVSDGASRAVA